MFQFPSNGKAYPKSDAADTLMANHSFNSLQTGKHIQSSNHLQPHYQIILFQFPSNGKAYPKYPAIFHIHVCRAKVSIPFKRESISKGEPEALAKVRERTCFNSLQTGKHIQRAPILSPVGPWLRDA